MGSMDPCFYALSKLRRRKYDECIETCNELLNRNNYDQSAWFIKTRALTNKNFIDDIEVEEEGLADYLLDDNAVSKIPRPGTSLNRPGTQSLGRPGTSSSKSDTTQPFHSTHIFLSMTVSPHTPSLHPTSTHQPLQLTKPCAL